jgi:hypothetical protein
MDLAVNTAILALCLVVFALCLAALGFTRGVAQRVRPGTRTLPVIQRQCRTCAYFDLEAGQRRYARQKVFQQMVAPFIQPAEYESKVVEVSANADGILENAAEVNTSARVPEQCSWDRFGLCGKHNDCLWEGTTAENRLQNMLDFTPDGVDCYEPREG